MTASLDAGTLGGVALASVRLMGMLTTAPLFSRSQLPARLRVLLSLALAWSLLPAGAAWDGEAVAPSGFLAAAAGELLIGAAIGFAANMLFAAFHLMGEFVSIQGGLGAARVVDPTSGAPSVVIASLLDVMALLVYLSIDGHHALLRGMAQSLEVLPVGAGLPDLASLASLALLGADVFETAVLLSLPVTVAMFVSNVGLGVLGRAIPQLNLMMLQLPAHVGGLLVLLGVGAQSYTDAVGAAVVDWNARVLALLLPGG